MAKTNVPMEAEHSQHVDRPKQTKPTTPAIKKSPGKPSQSRNIPIRMGANRVWNKVRPKKGVAGAGISKQSKIENFAKLTAVPDINYDNKTAHLAPGVPNNSATQKGYLPADAKPKITRGGSTDIGTANAYPAEAHTTYD
ncbi:MAG: hypothetical protein HWN68_15035 [Desulfobacterales bacterium]|nr:hypothetical protein [Desulfobacterales bacterium]